MTCELSLSRLQPYLDGELDAAGAADFERHLETCPDCQLLLAAETNLRESLAHAQLYQRAPASLRQKIQSNLPAPTPQSSPSAIAPSASIPSRSNLIWRWLAVAAILFLAVAVTWRQISSVPNRSYQQTLATAVVDAHLRSMQPGHLSDVISTDQHTVKPWFDGKLNFAPPVFDFSNDGFPLLGGRLDILNGRTAAALVYGRRKHIINVFVSKSQPAESWTGSGELLGYHWLAWQSGDFSFCAVSDVASADLDQLKQLLLQSTRNRD